MKKMLSDKKFFNDMVRYIHEIITSDMELEALSDEFLSDWRDRKKIKEQKNNFNSRLFRRR